MRRLCPTVGNGDRDDSIVRSQSLAQTAGEHHVGDLVSYVNDCFSIAVIKNLLQTLQSPIRCGLLLVVEEVLVYYDRQEGTTEALFRQYFFYEA